MASVILNGHIQGIKYTETSVIVIVSEIRNGYTDANGRKKDNEVLMWKVLYPKGMMSYIAKFFAKGMLVDIYGFAKPYAIDHDGNIIDGYTILGKNIDRACYQRSSIVMEKKMIKDSQLGIDDKPDLEGYRESDF